MQRRVLLNPRLSLSRFGGAALFVCGAVACTTKTPDAGSPDHEESVRDAGASFRQSAACEEPPPDTFVPEPSSGSWPIQVGVPEGQNPFTLFGNGCNIPIAGTFQGSQYARFAVRFPETESPFVYARFTLTSLENPDAQVARDVNYNVQQLGRCKEDGYCYVTPILANIVPLADVQDELRNHTVAVSVHLFEVENPERFGRTQVWGRLRFSDEDAGQPVDAGDSDAGQLGDGGHSDAGRHGDTGPDDPS